MSSSSNVEYVFTGFEEFCNVMGAAILDNRTLSLTFVLRGWGGVFFCFGFFSFPRQ